MATHAPGRSNKHQHQPDFAWLPTGAAAAYLGGQEKTLRRFVAAGQLQAYRLGGRNWRFKTTDLDALLVPVVGGIALPRARCRRRRWGASRSTARWRREPTDGKPAPAAAQGPDRQSICQLLHRPWALSNQRQDFPAAVIGKGLQHAFSFELCVKGVRVRSTRTRVYRTARR